MQFVKSCHNAYFIYKLDGKGSILEMEWKNWSDFRIPYTLNKNGGLS